jgi:hypothetical protein
MIKIVSHAPDRDLVPRHHAATRHQLLNAYKNDLAKDENNINTILKSFDLASGILDNREWRGFRIDGDGASGALFSTRLGD